MTAIVQGFVMGLVIGMPLAFVLLAMFRAGKRADDYEPVEHVDREP